MALSAAARSRLDSLLTDLAGAMAAKQAAYFDGDETIRTASADLDGKPVPAVTRKRRRFGQFLSTHTAIPTAGAATTPLRFAEKLNDSVERWSDQGLNLPAQLEASVRVDTYESSLGHGFVIRVTVASDSETWERARGFGPNASDYTHPWQRVEEAGP